MLAGVKVVDKAAAEAALREEVKASKKEKKALKKEKKAARKQSKRQGTDNEAGGSDRDAIATTAASSGGATGDVAADAERVGAPEEHAAAAKGGREDWMTTPMGRSVVAPPAEGDKPDRAMEAQERATIMAARELNPYYKGDGKDTAPPGAAAKVVTRPAGVGDGGSSWRLKALRRAQAQAHAEGVDLNQVVSERWGSVANLTAGLTEQRASHAKAHMLAARERRGKPIDGASASGGGFGGFDEDDRDGNGRDRGRASGGRQEPPGYLRSDRPQMRRPAAGSGFGRRASEGRPRDNGEGGSASDTSRGGPKITFPGSGRPDVPRSSEAAGDTYSNRREDTDRRSGNAVRHDGGGDRQHGSSARRSGDDGHGHCADGDGGRGDYRGNYQRGRSTWDPLGNRADADALRGAAASINAFVGDGSFMDQFKTPDPDSGGGGGGAGNSSDREDEGGPPDPSSRSRSPSPLTTMSMPPSQRGHGRHQHGTGPQPAVEGFSPAADTVAAAEEAAAKAELERPLTPAAPPAAPPTGNLSVAAALRARLLGKKAPPAASLAEGGSGGGRRGREVDILPSVDASGRAAPGAFGREAADAGALPPGRKPKRVQRYDAEGTRERWNADDDATDLATLVKRQKHEGAADMDAALAANIARKARFKETDLNADDEYDFDQGIDMYEKRKGDQAQQAKRQRSSAIADSRRLSRALEGCNLCISSPRRPKHLTLAIGQASCLMLPTKGSLAEGHCCIVPAEHVASVRRCEGAVATELRNFKKSLLQMFMSRDQDVVFFETAVRLEDARSHAVIEAVPLPPKAFSKAPLYFKKAVDDAESEWSQHHAKRYIDTRAKGLQGSIPPNFPYFHVEFGLASGFVHVIDEEATWDASFGRSVLAGLLGLPPHVGKATQKAEPEAIQRRAAAAFLKAYEPFDWTAQL